MLSFVLTAALALPALQDDDKGPPAGEVSAALERLDTAFSKGAAVDQIQAIESAVPVVAPAVIEALVDNGLRNKERDVRRATIGALGLMVHEDALDELHRVLKRDKKITKDPEVFELLIKSIGRHASPSSVDLLSKNVFKVPENRVVRARILALGNIRTNESLEALVGLMRVTRREKVQNNMEHFRTSLMILTGVDKGKSQQLWMGWWNDNKKTFEVGEKAPRLPKKMQQAWDMYWGRGRTYERGKKRGERGQDPEKDD